MSELIKCELQPTHIGDDKKFLEGSFIFHYPTDKDNVPIYINHIVMDGTLRVNIHVTRKELIGIYNAIKKQMEIKK